MVAHPFDVEESGAMFLIRRAKRTARWWAYHRRRAGSDKRRCRDTSPILMVGMLRYVSRGHVMGRGPHWPRHPPVLLSRFGLPTGHGVSEKPAACGPGVGPPVYRASGSSP